MDPSLMFLAAFVFIAAFWFVQWWQGRSAVNGSGLSVSSKRTQSSPMPPIQIPSDLDGDLRALMMRGEKIAAIKLLRKSSGLGLKESKDYVEALARKDAEVFPREL
ncbi:MAG: ribosomal protein L7/L12 [Thermosynechococcaceae cyanobacterium]